MKNTQMTGHELFEFYTSQGGAYSQTLFTAHLHIGDTLFSMLEDAEKQGKKIVIKEDMPGVDDSPVSIILKY